MSLDLLDRGNLQKLVDYQLLTSEEIPYLLEAPDVRESLKDKYSKYFELRKKDKNAKSEMKYMGHKDE
jgi:hypothetical protein